MSKELAAIGPDLFTLGFKLAGVRKTFSVEPGDNMREAIRLALEDDDIGVLVMRTEDLRALDVGLQRELEESIQPTLVTIGVDEDTALREKLKQAIGVDVWN